MSQLILQLSDGVLDQIKRLADRQRVTVEEYASRMLSETALSNEMWESRVERGRRMTREEYLAILNRAPGVPPMPGDEL